MMACYGIKWLINYLQALTSVMTVLGIHTQDRKNIEIVGTTKNKA